MKPDMSESNEKGAEKQALDTRIRIITLKRRFPFLDQRYLARKLKRSDVAISYALSGKGKKLLARIIVHLDYLERKAA
jgi:hypothetical protein